MAEVVSARMGADLLARLDEVRGDLSRGAWLLSAAEGALTGDSAIGGPAAGLEVTNEVPPGGIPSPGVYCQWAACWSRDTRRYGVADLGELARPDYRERARDEDPAGHALCAAHAARLGGLIYRRPVVPPRAGTAA